MKSYSSPRVGRARRQLLDQGVAPTLAGLLKHFHGVWLICRDVGREQQRDRLAERQLIPVLERCVAIERPSIEQGPVAAFHVEGGVAVGRRVKPDLQVLPGNLVVLNLKSRVLVPPNDQGLATQREEQALLGTGGDDDRAH